MGSCTLKVLCPGGVQYVQMLIRLDTAAMERLHLSGIAGKVNVIYTLYTAKIRGVLFIYPAQHPRLGTWSA